MSNKHSKQTKKAPPKTKEKQSAGTIVKNIFIFGLLFSLIAVLAGVCVFLFYAKDAPELDEAKLTDSLSSKFYDSSGNLVEELGEKIRENVTANEIPDNLKNAVISIEDKRFEKHFGIDPIRIVGAAVNNIFGKGTGQQGGSTLTQQLIKLSFFTTESTGAESTLKRKAQEAWLAMKLERTKSKDEILAYYINKTYMSNGVYGMETAAKVFYGKTLSELSLAQTALLAGLPQAPTDYDPYVHPDAAKTRRDMVLGQMYEDGKISKTDYDAAVATPIDDGLQPIDTSSTQINKIADNYLKQVIEEVQEKTGKNIYTDGLSIYMNIDMDAQTYLYNLVNSDDTIQFPDDEFQTAVTMVDVNNGQIKAQIGGRKIADDVQLGENLAVSPNRDVGSTVKPIFDYGPAFEYLYKSTGSIIDDSPITNSDTGKPINNYDNQYLGNITLRYAVTDSRNVPAVKTFREVGVNDITTFVNGLGISYDLMTENDAISGKISTLQLAEAYAAFANGGIYYQPSYVNKIVYQDGREETYDDEGTRAMSEATAYMMTDVLKGVISTGTGKNATIANLYQAGKTGTSNYDEEVLPQVIGDKTGSPDISFAGYTRSYSIAVWTGYYDYYRAIPKADQTIASSIYRNLMTHVSQSVENTNWEKPSTVVQSGSELYVKGHTQNMPSQSYTYQPTTPSYYDDDDTDYYSSSSSSDEQPASSSTNSAVVPDNSTSSSASPTPTPSTSSEEQNIDPDVTPSPPVNN